MGITTMGITTMTTVMESLTLMDGFRVTRITATTMREPAGQAALLRLMTWLSPAFPVGAFAYSHGIERAVHDGVIVDRAGLTDWLIDLVERGSGWNDAVLLAEAWRAAAAREDCAEVAKLAGAMAGSRERHMETTLQGEAFASAAKVWSAASISASQKGDGDSDAVSYPVAVGATAAAHGIDLEAALAAYLHAFTSNLVQAAVRLVPLGQRDGVATMAGMEAVMLEVAERAAQSSLDDLGSATFLSDIMSMKHEVQYSRVFRS
jgi:urease accessory protein